MWAGETWTARREDAAGRDPTDPGRSRIKLNRRTEWSGTTSRPHRGGRELRRGFTLSFFLLSSRKKLRYDRPMSETNSLSRREFILLAQEGARVRATTRVYDLPGTPWPEPIQAEPGDEGTVVHAQEGLLPTVRFDRTGGATCVTEQEVELLNTSKENE